VEAGHPLRRLAFLRCSHLLALPNVFVRTRFIVVLGVAAARPIGG
jgi:hypothetical protein